MAIAKLVPPAPISQQLGWEAMKEIRPFVDNIVTIFTNGSITVAESRRIFSQFERYYTNLGNLVSSGLLDGDPSIKSSASAILASFGNIAAVATPIQQKYSKLVGDKISAEASLGNVLSIDEAAALILLDATDVTTILNTVQAELV